MIYLVLIKYEFNKNIEIVFSLTLNLFDNR